jgi:hypothetical protein
VAIKDFSVAALKDFSSVATLKLSEFPRPTKSVDTSYRGLETACIYTNLPESRYATEEQELDQ